MNEENEYEEMVRVIKILQYADPIKQPTAGKLLGWLQAKRYRENSLKF